MMYGVIVLREDSAQNLGGEIRVDSVFWIWMRWHWQIDREDIKSEGAIGGCADGVLHGLW